MKNKLLLLLISIVAVVVTIVICALIDAALNEAPTWAKVAFLVAGIILMVWLTFISLSDEQG